MLDPPVPPFPLVQCIQLHQQQHEIDLLEMAIR
jgi:hypothetical protein